MFTDVEGPIERFEWGRFTIDGQVHSMDGEGVGKDIFLLGRDVHPWKTRKGHRLEPKMVPGILAGKVEVLVIGNGVNGALKVPKQTRKTILAAGVAQLIVKPTPEACALYNQLVRQGKQAALLAHGTC